MCVCMCVCSVYVCVAPLYQVYAQTIDVLVAEKSQLQSDLSTQQRLAEERRRMLYSCLSAPLSLSPPPQESA